MAFAPDTAFNLLRRADAQDRLAHAYLLAGPPGSGKRGLATRLAALATRQPPDDPGVLAHPDIHIAEPESKSRRIVIDQVRALERELQMRSLRGAKKVGLVFDADRLVPAASNAFLKTLEEPPANSLLILVTAEPEALLDTIISRCVVVTLAGAAQAPLTAPQARLLAMLRDFFKKEHAGLAQTFAFTRELMQLLKTVKEEIAGENAGQFKEEEKRYRQSAGADWADAREDHYKALGESRYLLERARLIDTLLRWWADVLRHQHGAPRLDFADCADDTARLAGTLTTPQILARLGELEKLRENLGRNVQEALAIEVALLRAFA